MLLEADPEAKEADIKQAVQKLVNYQQAVMDGKPITVKETNPAQSAEKAIILTKKVDREKLQDAGFLEDPDVALMRYTSNMVKRVEWNRNTKDDYGNSIYEEELKKLDPKAEKKQRKSYTNTWVIKTLHSDRCGVQLIAGELCYRFSRSYRLLYWDQYRNWQVQLLRVKS